MPAEPARFVLTLSCGARRGIVAAVANSTAARDCNIVESARAVRFHREHRVLINGARTGVFR